MPTSPQRAALRRERMARAVELHERGLRQQEIGDELGITQVSAGRLLRAARAVTHTPGRPAKYPTPEPRACEHCGTMFTPRYPSLAVGPHGRFCLAECRVAGLRKHDPVGERVCANPNCSKTFTPHASNARRGGGIYCSEKCRKTGETITCKQCGRTRYVPKSHLSRLGGFCSLECWGIELRKHRGTLLARLGKAQFKRTGNTKFYGRHAAEIAAEREKQVGLPEWSPRRVLTEEKRQRVLAMRARGRTYGEISAATGLSIGSVRHVLKTA